MVKQGNLLALKTGTTTLTFWSAQTGGTQYTDLLDDNSAAISSVVVSGYQIPSFSGPDGVASMWAYDGRSDRFKMEARVANITGATLSADNTFTGKNVFTGKQELNGGFTNSYDTALWIAPTTRSNPTNNSQGLYIQHRVSNNLGGLVHDAGASELRLNAATNTGAGQSAHENSLVVTGGANTIGLMTGTLSNFHTEGTPSGTITEVALFRGTQVPPLTGTITIGTIYGLHLSDQIAGAANYSLYSEGKVYFPYAVPNSTTGAALIARGLSTTVAGTDLLSVQNATPTTLFRVTSSGTGGIGSSISGTSWWVNNNNATGTTVVERIRAHSSQSVNLTEWQESGGTAHIKVTAATSSLRANLVMASSAIAQASTDGFLYLSSMAGAPSGTPTTFTGNVPIVIDTTNNKLMAYIGGAWKGVTLA